MSREVVEEKKSTGEILEERKPHSYKIFDDIAGTYDLLNRLLSFRIDVYWRNQLLKHLPKQDSLEVVDLATGTADLALTLAKDHKVNKVLGLDLSKEMIAIGKQKVTKSHQEKIIHLDIGDATNLELPDQSYDLVTISFGIRNFSDPKKSLDEIYRILRTNGRLLILEFSLPKNFFIRQIYFFYFRNLLPWIGNIISGHKDAYTYLNQSVEHFPYGERFAEMVSSSGFKNVHFKTLSFGISTLYIADKT